MLDTRLWTAVADPDEHLAVFVSREAFGVNQIGLEIFDVLIIDAETSLEHAVRYASLTLQQFLDLREHFIECHDLPSEPLYSSAYRRTTRRLSPAVGMLRAAAEDLWALHAIS